MATVFNEPSNTFNNNNIPDITILVNPDQTIIGTGTSQAVSNAFLGANYYTISQVNSLAFSGGSVNLTNYFTSGQTTALFQPIGSYLSTITSGNVISALGYTPLSGSTTLSGYGILSGDSLFNSKYYPLSSNPAGYLVTITSGNVITALGYTPSSGGTGVSAFSGLTGKPTTLQGYGILSGDSLFTNVYYPISNPYGFISGVTSGSVISALGYTPAQNGTSGATLFSPSFSGTPTAPTPVSGTNTTQIATTAFVQTAISTISGGTGVSSFSGLTGKPTTLVGYGISSGDTLFNSVYYPLTNPNNFISGITFAGISAKPITLSGYSITSADTLFNNNYYPLVSNPSGYITTVTSGSVITALGYNPASGTTATSGTSTSQLATTAFVQQELSGSSVSFATGVFSGSGTTAIPYTLVMDNYPTSGDTVPVSSDGVYQALNLKQNLIATGSSSQYLKGNGSLASLPTTLSGFSISTGDTLFDSKYFIKSGDTVANGIGLLTIASAATPTTGITLYHTSSGLTWKGSSGIQRAFNASALTADRVYSLPDSSGVLQLTQNTLSGYGITSADTLFNNVYYPLISNPSGYLTNISGLTAGTGINAFIYSNTTGATISINQGTGFTPTWAGIHTFAPTVTGTTVGLNAVITMSASTSGQTQKGVMISGITNDGVNTTVVHDILSAAWNGDNFHIYDIGGGGTVYLSNAATPSASNYFFNTNGTNTFLNAPAAGGTVFLRVNNGTVGQIDSTGLFKLFGALPISTGNQDALWVSSPTLTTSGSGLQNSFSIRQTANVFNTTQTLNNQIDFRQYITGLSGTTPTGTLNIQASIVTGTTPSYGSSLLTIDTGGNVGIPVGTLTVTNTLLAGVIGGSARNFYQPLSAAALSSINPQYLIGGAATTFFRVGLGTTGGTSTALTSGATYSSVVVAQSNVTTFTSGTHNVVTNLGVTPVIITNSGATVLNNTNFFSGPAGSGGTNNYSTLLSGATRIDLGSDATGDLLYRGSANGGGLVRLPIGTNGQALVISGGIPAWSTQAYTQASADITAQTSATTIATFTVGASNATFEVSAYLNITAVATDIIQIQIAFTDQNNNAQTFSLATLSSVGNSAYSPIILRAKAATVITVKSNLTNSSGSITYDAGARIIQI